MALGPPTVCVAAYLSLWEHQEQKGEEGWGQPREAGRGTTGILSLSRCLLISPQGIARDLGLTQPHLSYSQVISGV